VRQLQRQNVVCIQKGQKLALRAAQQRRVSQQSALALLPRRRTAAAPSMLRGRPKCCASVTRLRLSLTPRSFS
jgi:hypothetical protein